MSRLAAAEILGKSALNEAQLRQLLRAVRGDLLISPDVVLPAVNRSVSEGAVSDVVDYLSLSIRRGWRPTEAHLSEIIEGLPTDDKADSKSLFKVLRQQVALQQSTLSDLEGLLVGGDAIQPAGIPLMITGIIMFCVISADLLTRYRIRIKRPVVKEA